MPGNDSGHVSSNGNDAVDRHSFASGRDSVANTILVAFIVSLVCSVMVSTSVVLLKPKQLENQLIHSGLRNVIELISSIEKSRSNQELIGEIDTRLVDLETGEYVTGMDAAQFNPRAAASDPDSSVAIPPDLDIANIERRAKFARVSLVKEGDHIKYIVLPVYGAGMWSTIYGYIALEADGNTIAGLNIYEQAETPGIGDKVEDPSWLDKWEEKCVYRQGGKPAIEIVKGKLVAKTRYQVDALTGATKTGEGVTNMLLYWFGSHGFKPYLEKIRKKVEKYDSKSQRCAYQAVDR